MDQAMQEPWVKQNREEMHLNRFRGEPEGEVLTHIQSEAQRLRNLRRSLPAYTVVYSEPRQVLWIFQKLVPVNEAVLAWDAGVVDVSGVKYFLAIGEDGQAYATLVAPHRKKFLNALRIQDFHRRVPRLRWRKFLLCVYRKLEGK